MKLHEYQIRAMDFCENKRKVVAHKYAHLITEQEQRTKFVRLYNGLNAVLNYENVGG